MTFLEGTDQTYMQNIMYISSAWSFPNNCHEVSMTPSVFLEVPMREKMLGISHEIVATLKISKIPKRKDYG